MEVCVETWTPGGGASYGTEWGEGEGVGNEEREREKKYIGPD